MIRKLRVTGTKKKKNPNSFLFWKKIYAIQNQTKTFVANGEVVKKHTEINKNLYTFAEDFFQS